MIFDEIVAEVCERLNLTSDEARSRVGREVNARYRRLTSSIGLVTSRRTQVSKTATIGSQSITFGGIEKITAVIDKSSGSDITLTEITMSEFHDLSIRDQPPRNFVVNRTNQNSVEILMDCVPTTGFTLYADGHINLATLAGSQAPSFPESFHDILIFGVLADEYRKMEKLDFARDSELVYEARLSDLRMFLAKSAYLDIYPGKKFSRTNWMGNVWNE